MTDKTQPNTPVAEFPYGSVKAAVWKKDTENGPSYSIRLTRSYTDKEGRWKNTDYLGRNDLIKGMLSLLDAARFAFAPSQEASAPEERVSSEVPEPTEP